MPNLIQLTLDGTRGKSFTCLEPPVEPSGPVGNDRLDLEELVDVVVAADDREPEALGRLDQLAADALAA